MNKFFDAMGRNLFATVVMVLTAAFLGYNAVVMGMGAAKQVSLVACCVVFVLALLVILLSQLRIVVATELGEMARKKFAEIAASHSARAFSYACRNHPDDSDKAHRQHLELAAIASLAGMAVESHSVSAAKECGKQVRAAIDAMSKADQGPGTGAGRSQSASDFPAIYAAMQASNQSAAPQTLPEALDVIRSMHSALVDFRHPEFDLVAPGREGEFDERVKAVLAHSAPVIRADREAFFDCSQHNEPTMPAGVRDGGAADKSIEAEIQAKGKTAARVTPADIEANIVAEYVFTLDKALAGSPLVEGLERVTLAVLVLRNGTKLVGVNYGAIDPARHNADEGRKSARENAVEQIWPLMGYELRTQLANKMPCTCRGPNEVCSSCPSAK